MSLVHIKRLLVEDHIIKFPALTTWAIHRQKVITVLATSCWMHPDKGQQLVELGMLHINTQGQAQWTIGVLKPTYEPPASWLKAQHIDSLEGTSTWDKNWSAGIKHIAANNQVVVLNQNDLDVVRNQYKDKNGVPTFDTAVCVKNIYQNRHPNKSATLNDMMLYYQVQADSDTVKGRLLCITRVLEAMHKERSLMDTPQNSINTSKSYSTSMLTLDDARKWLVRSQAAATSAVDFFERCAQKVPYCVHLSSAGRLQGYSVFVEGQWKKGSELETRLAWAQLYQDHGWTLNESDMELIKKLSAQKES